MVIANYKLCRPRRKKIYQLLFGQQRAHVSICIYDSGVRRAHAMCVYFTFCGGGGARTIYFIIAVAAFKGRARALPRLMPFGIGKNLWRDGGYGVYEGFSCYYVPSCVATSARGPTIRPHTTNEALSSGSLTTTARARKFRAMRARN